MTLLERIGQRRAPVGIIGMGYVGLPLVREFCGAGFAVTGFDIDATKVEKLQRGESYIKHIPSDLIASIRAQQQFSATTDFARLAEVDAIIICVPTPLTDMREPDLSYVRSTAESIAPVLRADHLIVLESTTYPGTTRDVVLPILERTGKRCGQDFFLAYSPEREDPGNPEFTTGTIPKVVGGVDAASCDLAVALYDQIVVRTVPVSSAEAAEACKILENTYRAVNIALVNELKVLFDRMGINVWEVIASAATKPFGFQPFYPGPGLGGHCIPIDPFYLSWIARKYDVSTRFIELAGEVNTHMPYYVISRLADALNEQGKPVKGSRVLMLGAAYKKDVDDPRESPSFVLLELLEARGAVISYNDPHIPVLPHMRRHRVQLTSVELTEATLSAQDCVLIATDHTAYDYDFVVRHSRLVVDTRNATQGVTAGRDRIVLA